MKKEIKDLLGWVDMELEKSRDLVKENTIREMLKKFSSNKNFLLEYDEHSFLILNGEVKMTDFTLFSIYDTESLEVVIVVLSTFLQHLKEVTITPLKV